MDQPKTKQHMFFKKSYDHNRHDKKTFLENDVKSVSSMEVTVGAPKGYYGPTKRHQWHGVEYERPGFNCVTMKMKEIPEGFNMRDEVRNLASKGHVVLDSKIDNNLITNKRTGSGMLHVRSKTNKEVNEIKEEMAKNGVTVEVCDRYQPVWH